jgi:probable F420-dependent oxidoreductase
MKLAFFGINAGPLATDPDMAAAVAQHAEQAGYDSVWAGEHMCVPTPQAPPSPLGPTDPILDPIPALTWAAANTTALRIGTGVLLMPQRNPVALAKELASLDVLSKGRLLVGVGIGYLEPEFRAVGASMERRGERTMEYVAAMQALWSMEQPSFAGEFVSFDGIDAYPRPVRPDGPPIVMGGHTAAAFRRAVQGADEWYGFRCDLDRTTMCLDGLAKAQARYGLTTKSGRLVISITPAAPLTTDLVAQYAALGVDRLIVMTGNGELDHYRRFLDDNAALVS